MSVSLTLTLPDLHPDTIRAAFAALLPPLPAAPAEAPSIATSPDPAEVILLEKAPEPSVEPAPVEERPAERAVRVAREVGLTRYTLNVGPVDASVTLPEPDWLPLAADKEAHVAWVGFWSVRIDGVSFETYRPDRQELRGDYLVTAPEPEPEPVEAPPLVPAPPDDAPPYVDDDVPF